MFTYVTGDLYRPINVNFFFESSISMTDYIPWVSAQTGFEPKMSGPQAITCLMSTDSIVYF